MDGDREEGSGRGRSDLHGSSEPSSGRDHAKTLLRGSMGRSRGFHDENPRMLNPFVLILSQSLVVS